MVRNYVRPPQSSVNHSTTEFPLQHIVSDVGYPRGRSLPRVLWNALGVHSTLCPQARLEVHRFGITGYGKGKERLLERERAIMLGAQVRGCFCLISRQDTYRKGENPGQGRGGVTGRSLQNKKMVSLGFIFPVAFQPPKNSYVNYKVLQEQIKEKKAAKEEEKRMVRVKAVLLPS